MYSLKKASGTFKGLVGECMFRLAKKESILTHFQSKEQAEKQLKDLYTSSQIKFLLNNWDTIDAIDTKEPKIYEIKTKSCDYGKYKTRMMANCHNILKKANGIGIKPVLVIIKLEEDWLYELIEEDYLKVQADLDIIVPKKYNKPYERILG